MKTKKSPTFAYSFGSRQHGTEWDLTSQTLQKVFGRGVYFTSIFVMYRDRWTFVRHAEFLSFSTENTALLITDISDILMYMQLLQLFVDLNKLTCTVTNQKPLTTITWITCQQQCQMRLQYYACIQSCDISAARKNPTKWSVHTAKTWIRPVWSVFIVRWVAKDLHADSEDSDWADVHAHLSPCWVHRWFCWVCHAAAQIEYISRSYQSHLQQIKFHATKQVLAERLHVSKSVSSSRLRLSKYFLSTLRLGERGGSVVECRTPEWEVRGSKPTAAMLCPWAWHFTPQKYCLITQEAVAPSRHDWKIVDWDVKPQHKQTLRLKIIVSMLGVGTYLW